VRRAAVIGISVAAGAVVAVGLGAGIWTVTRPASPSDVVLTYFSALESGDARAALAVTTTPEEGVDDAVDAYASVGDEISEVRVTSSTHDSDAARVIVSYTLAGHPGESSLALAASPDGGWMITDGLAQLTPTTTLGGAVAIGDLRARAGASIPLLPGRYDVEALPRGLVSGSATVHLRPGIRREVEVAASLAPAATAAAQEQLDAYAAACTAASSAVPPNCGLRVPWAADLATLTSVAFRVEQLPTVALSPDGTTFAATGGVIIATATGTTRQGGTASFTYRADDWALRGTVSFPGDEMVLAVG
jgi:hypothetical protein